MSLQAKWSGLFWDCNFVHFVSGSTHQTVNFHTGTALSRVKGLIYQVDAANETSGQPCSDNSFIDGVLDIKTPMQTTLSVFVGKPTSLFHLHGSDSWGDNSFIKKCLLSLCPYPCVQSTNSDSFTNTCRSFEQCYFSYRCSFLWKISDILTSQSM